MRFLYGTNPVMEALRAHPGEIKRVLIERGRDGRRSQGGDKIAELAKALNVRVEDAAFGDLTRRTQGGVHQGVGAEMSDLAYVEVPDLIEAAGSADRPPFLLVLDGVTDPQNFGALVRSAYALGCDGVVIPKDRSAGMTPAASKAAAGALEHCKIARVTNLSRAIEELKEAGVWTVALAAEGDRELAEVDLTSPIALVMGSEGAGVRKMVREHCDHVARIPMAGNLGSLNVSAAGAIAMYEVVRQRR